MVIKVLHYICALYSEAKLKLLMVSGNSSTVDPPAMSD
jgi:hypothetical protein